MNRQIEVQAEYRRKVTTLLRVEMIRHSVDYPELARRVNENAKILEGKIVRGTISTKLFFQCLEACGCRMVVL